MLSRAIGSFLGHSFLGWESLELGSVQRMGGLTREELLPQPRETRMCVLRLTLHVPEEEAEATGPSQTTVDVPGQASGSSRSGSAWGGWGCSVATVVPVPRSRVLGEGGMEQFPLQGESTPSSSRLCPVNSEGQMGSRASHPGLQFTLSSCWS